MTPVSVLNDYVKLLSNIALRRSDHGIFAEQGAQALQAAGYATDPKYAQKLVGMNP